MSSLVVWWESHSPIAVSMLLAHSLRRWPNIETSLGECPAFGGQVLAMRIFSLQAYINVPDVDAIGEPTLT